MGKKKKGIAYHTLSIKDNTKKKIVIIINIMLMSIIRLLFIFIAFTSVILNYSSFILSFQDSVCSFSSGS